MPFAAAATLGAAAIGAYASHKASSAASDAANRAADANAWQGDIAKEQYDDYKTTYQPLEHQMVAEASDSASPAAYEKAAADAQGTVQSQIGLARDRLARTPGADPSSAAAQAASASLELKGAALGAQAQNQARTQVTNQSWAKKMDALGLGKGLVTGASTGMANAANTAQAIQKSSAAEASQTASGVGSMVSGAITQFGKSDLGGKLADGISSLFKPAPSGAVDNTVY